MEHRFVYMDYNATTPIRPEVRDRMVEALDIYANASSMHEAGRRARAEIEKAREQVAALIGAPDPQSIYFTSGGSESNNTVFMTMFDLGRSGKASASCAHASGSLAATKHDAGGLSCEHCVAGHAAGNAAGHAGHAAAAPLASPTDAAFTPALRKKIITTAIEHPCVLNAAQHLADEGFPVVFLPVDADGRIDMAQLEKELDDTTLLVSVMSSNNEIGTCQDIPRIARLAHRAGAYMHTDATQSVGKVPVAVVEWDVDYLTMSCHKLYGPKGIGALFVRPGVPVTPLVRGGHQEKGVRAGTYNNLGILGFGKAAELALRDMASFPPRVRKLRNELRDKIAASIPHVRINGHPDEVLPNTLNVSFLGAEGEAILLSLDIEGIEVSTGSACASGSLEPSHVLMATGASPELAHGSIRFSLGRDTTEEDIAYVAEKLPPIIARLRKMSTLSH